MENLKSKNIHWFPGHMKKASIKIDEYAKFVDFVIVILDSRAPLSSFNEYLLKAYENKPKLFILNKIDLCDNRFIDKWVEYFTKNGDKAIKLNSKKNLKALLSKEIDEITAQKRAKQLSRGIKNPIFKGIVVGVPNAGKSTFINGLLGTKRLVAEDRPGVTKSTSWIKLNDNYMIMDTPGVLTPKFSDKEISIKLALIGSIKLDILPLEDLTQYLTEFLMKNYKDELKKYLDTKLDNDIKSDGIVEIIAKTKLPLKKGGELDLDLAHKKLLNDFRDNKITNFTMDRI